MPASLGHRHSGWTLLVVCVAVFMLVLDMTVVAVALADIQRDLHGDLESLQWVIDAYTLTLAGLLLTAATVGDRRGRRAVFVAGLVIFTLASAGCAAAWSPLSLNLIRAVQGIGGALLFGTAMPMVGAVFLEPAARAKAIGAAGASVTAATALGPLIGGVLVNMGGWRWIFAINVPIGILLFLVMPRVSESRAQKPRRADWSGSFLLTGSLLTGLLGLIRGNSDGWSSFRVVGLLIASVVLLLAFLAREHQADQPMLDLGLFRIPRFVGLGIAAVISSASLIASSTYLALYLSNVFGYTPLTTGLRMLPLTVPALIAAPLAASLMQRFPLWILVTAAVGLSGAGLMLASAVQADSDWQVFIPGFVVGGIGLGMIGAVLPGGALTTVEPDRYGMAVGSVNTLRHIGIAAGVAGLGALFERTATDRATTLLRETPLPPESSRPVADAVGSGAGIRVAEGLTEPLHSVLVAVGRAASAEGLSQVLLLAGVVAVVGALLGAPLVAPTPAIDVQSDESQTMAAAVEEPARPDRPVSTVATGRHVSTESDLDRTAVVADVPLRERSREQESKGAQRMTRHGELQGVIGDIHETIPGLNGIMVASFEGLPIVHDFPPETSERIAAMAVTATGLGARLADRTSLGGFHETIVHGESGYLLAYPAGEQAVLLIHAPIGSNLGLVRLEAQSATQIISRALG